MKGCSALYIVLEGHASAAHGIDIKAVIDNGLSFTG